MAACTEVSCCCDAVTVESIVALSRWVGAPWQYFDSALQMSYAAVYCSVDSLQCEVAACSIISYVFDIRHAFVSVFACRFFHSALFLSPYIPSLSLCISFKRLKTFGRGWFGHGPIARSVPSPVGIGASSGEFCCRDTTTTTTTAECSQGTAV